MKKLFAILFMLMLLVGCSGETEEKESIATYEYKKPATSCTASKYKTNAIPLMNEFNSIMRTVDLNDPSSIRAGKTELQSLQSEINRVECKGEFPLKHETLEYTVKHTMDFFDYVLEGDLTKADQALSKAELNADRFADWSEDMD